MCICTPLPVICWIYFRYCYNYSRNPLALFFMWEMSTRALIRRADCFSLPLSPSDFAKGQSSAGEPNRTDLRIVSLRISENGWNKDSTPLRKSSQLWFPPICWEMLLSKCGKCEQRWPFCASEGRSSFSIHLCRPSLIFIEYEAEESYLHCSLQDSKQNTLLHHAVPMSACSVLATELWFFLKINMYWLQIWELVWSTVCVMLVPQAL